MTWSSTTGHAMLALVFVSLLFPAPAYAYLDPGTGSLLVQSIIAGLAAAGYAVRMNWQRIQHWFGRGSRSQGPSNE
jgi:hypothetical protein